MQFIKLSAFVLSSAVVAAFAQTTTQRLVYDTMYDNSNGAVANTICAGLATSNPTFGSFKTYPNVGGSFTIQTYNSPACGSCWELTHSRDGQSNTTYFTAINSAPAGFVISLGGETALTGYQRNEIPANVFVQATEVDRSHCN